MIACKRPEDIFLLTSNHDKISLKLPLKRCSVTIAWHLLTPPHDSRLLPSVWGSSLTKLTSRRRVGIEESYYLAVALRTTLKVVGKAPSNILILPATSDKMGGGSRTRMATTLPLLAKKPIGQQIQSIYTNRLGQFTDSGTQCSPPGHILEQADQFQVNTIVKVSGR